MSDFSTPMMVQYTQLKEQYQDCLLFFRLGDFYELFLEDAQIGAKILGITLTARPRGKDGDIPMAGVPYHSADSYIAKLVKAGYKVAICEQVSEPNSRSIVERAVVRIITPGTLLDEKHLEQRENNYVFCISESKGKIGLVVADLSTGTLQLTEFPKAEVDDTLRLELKRFMPSECIIQPSSFDKAKWKSILDSYQTMTVFPFYNWTKAVSNREEVITAHFNVKNLAALHLHKDQAQTQALAATLGYFQSTQQHQLTHLTRLSFLQSDKYLTLDPATWENLEVFASLNRDQGHTLIGILDQTQTAMGGRLLRSWIKHPLRDIALLQKRQDAIEFLLDHHTLVKQLREQLATISDIERQLSRLSVGLGNPRDCVSLCQSMNHALSLIDLFPTADLPSWLATQCNKIDPTLTKLTNHITETLTQSPPIDVKKGNVIQPGKYPSLDRLRETIQHSQQWILEFEEGERQRTGISSLKIRFNKVFGYYIEVSKSNLAKVPPEYQRKQTLVSSERFTTDDLKSHEAIILESLEEINQLESEYFEALVTTILESVKPIQQLARAIAHIDVITSLAYTAAHNRYIRPTFNT